MPRRKRKSVTVEDSAKKKEICSNENVDEGDSNEESSSDEASVEYLAVNRERRANAGNKMASLIESTEQDEFYKSTYEGGFLEDDVDNAFQSPGASDTDEVDSDFDKSEEEDEPISDEDLKEGRKRRKNVYKEPIMQPRRDSLGKHKKWFSPKVGGKIVAANRVSPETQAALLEEAKKTERLNVSSLRRYERYELERKKKREKSKGTRKLLEPFIRSHDGPDGKWILIPHVRKFNRPEKKPKVLCCVTSKPAKYRDPVTGLPYANVEAFKILRSEYTKYLRTLKGDREVTEWLSGLS